jgi:hypothetical protein
MSLLSGDSGVSARDNVRAQNVDRLELKGPEKGDRPHVSDHHIRRRHQASVSQQPMDRLP